LVCESAQEILVVVASEAQPRFEGVNLEECSAAFFLSCGEPFFVCGGVNCVLPGVESVVALVRSAVVIGLRNVRVVVLDVLLGRK